jgi:uncharacterized membrane protein
MIMGRRKRIRGSLVRFLFWDRRRRNEQALNSHPLLDTECMGACVFNGNSGVLFCTVIFVGHVNSSVNVHFETIYSVASE